MFGFLILLTATRMTSDSNSPHRVAPQHQSWKKRKGKKRKNIWSNTVSSANFIKRETLSHQVRQIMLEIECYRYSYTTIHFFTGRVPLSRFYLFLCCFFHCASYTSTRSELESYSHTLETISFFLSTRWRSKLIQDNFLMCVNWRISACLVIYVKRLVMGVYRGCLEYITQCYIWKLREAVLRRAINLPDKKSYFHRSQLVVLRI